MGARILNLEKLTAKFAALPKQVREAAIKANDDNANDFMAQVAAIVPRGDRVPHLASTLEKAPGVKPGSTKVSIGGPQAPYPAHLEFGHLAKGGRHVPAEPFWFTTLRVNKKRFKNRRNRLARAAIRTLSAS